MARILLILGLITTVSVSIAPNAVASHYGPCTHEWVEVVPGYLVQGLKEEGVKGLAENAENVAYYCVLYWVNRAIGPITASAISIAA